MPLQERIRTLSNQKRIGPKAGDMIIYDAGRTMAKITRVQDDIVDFGTTLRITRGQLTATLTEEDRVVWRATDQVEIRPDSQPTSAGGTELFIAGGYFDDLLG